MGKKKSSRGSSSRGDDSYDGYGDDETASNASSADLPPVTTGGKEVVYCAASATEALLDALQEKRSTTREAALKGLMETLTSHVQAELVEDKYDSLSQGFLACLRKGKVGEQVLAARCLGLLALTLGASDACEDLLTSALPHLSKIVRSAGHSGARIASLDAVGVVSFVGAMDPAATEESMALLWGVANPPSGGKASTPAAVRSTAISNWTLLLSTLPIAQLATLYTRSELEVLSRLLQDPELSVRGAAGEAIALVYEYCAPSAAASNAAATSSESPPARSTGTASSVSSDSDDSIVDGVLNPEKPVGAGRPSVGQVSVDRAVQHMAQLTVGGSKQMGKKDRLSQKLAFREMLSTIRDNGQCSETVIRLKHGDTLRVSTWSQTVQLNALRKFLADGFQRHLQENELLHEVFGYQPRTEKKEVFQTAVQKRMLLSPNSDVSRNRAVERRRSRLAAHANNHSFFCED